MTNIHNLIVILILIICLSLCIKKNINIETFTSAEAQAQVAALTKKLVHAKMAGLTNSFQNYAAANVQNYAAYPANVGGQQNSSGGQQNSNCQIEECNPSGCGSLPKDVNFLHHLQPDKSELLISGLTLLNACKCYVDPGNARKDSAIDKLYDKIVGYCCNPSQCEMTPYFIEAVNELNAANPPGYPIACSKTDLMRGLSLLLKKETLEAFCKKLKEE